MAATNNNSGVVDIPEPLDWTERTNSVEDFRSADWLNRIADYAIAHKVSLHQLIQVNEKEFGEPATTSSNIRFLKRAGLLIEDNGIVDLGRQMRHWLKSDGGDAAILIGVIHSRIKLIGELLAELDVEPKTIEQLRSLAVSKYELAWTNTAQVARRLQWLEFAGLVERDGSHRAITRAGRDMLSQLHIYVPDTPSREPRYWLMSLGEHARFWDECYRDGIACLGWDDLGDLTQYQSREEIAAQGLGKNDSLACWEFGSVMERGDIIFSKRTRRGAGQALGHGIVTSRYRFDSARNEYRNVRKVEWLSNFPEGVAVRDKDTVVKTLTDISQYREMVQQFKVALGIGNGTPDRSSYSIDTILDEGAFVGRSELERLKSRLKEKKNLILQGPPGTGKTWLAKRLAYALIGKRDPRRVCAVQFHPTLSYEDFVYGWRPADGGLDLVDGTFLRAIEVAKNSSDPFVVVIEEINRGNPAQIFGELITLLEADKRTVDAAIELAYARPGEPRTVYVPENLYVIGTMNIADRSLALVDLALRRRFAFATLEPRLDDRWRNWVVEELGVDGDLVADIQRRMVNLNDSIAGERGLGKQFRVGHSYVTPTRRLASGDTRRWFRHVVDTEIVPLLEEYWFDDVERVRKERDDLLANW